MASAWWQCKRGRNDKDGIQVDEVITLMDAPEYWSVPPAEHCIAYIVDVRDTPKCLKARGKTTRGKILSVDAYIKKQCQDSVTGPSGSYAERSLADVVVLDDDQVIPCRRSNLSCNGAYICNFADPQFLENCVRWDDAQADDDLISGPIREAKVAEAGSVIAIATAFYDSAMNKRCGGKLNPKSDEALCGGHAIQREFRAGKVKGKYTFIGCANWSREDGIHHRFTAIPEHVGENIISALFNGDPIYMDDDDYVSLPCRQIAHPAHLPQKNRCPRAHYEDGRRVQGTLVQHKCPAKLTIFIPTNPSDLRAVVIPVAGVPHNHLLSLPAKVPFIYDAQYEKCAKAFGPIGATILRVDKAPSTRGLLNQMLPQQTHSSLVNNRRRRDIVHRFKTEEFPRGTGLEGVQHEFEEDRKRKLEERYIHSVLINLDDTYVIVTVEPRLAPLVFDASYIMVDSTFSVVHGSTNEWKLLVWSAMAERCVVVARVWVKGQSRHVYQSVWQGFFSAIHTITGKSLNFKVFSPSSHLLAAIGDAEVNGVPTVDTTSILTFIWKTCRVHFDRGVDRLKPYVEDKILQYLHTLPYLENDQEIAEYIAFCTKSANVHIQNWWADKVKYRWLLPSLNRYLSKMSNNHWDVTPIDTNAIEGSRAEDNRIDKGDDTFLEAILKKRKADAETADVFEKFMESGIWANGNNSLRTRFTSQATRAAKAREKRQMDGAEKKRLQGQLQASELEIQNLHRSRAFHWGITTRYLYLPHTAFAMLIISQHSLHLLSSTSITNLPSRRVTNHVLDYQHWIYSLDESYSRNNDQDLSAVSLNVVYDSSPDISISSSSSASFLSDNALDSSEILQDLTGDIVLPLPSRSPSPSSEAHSLSSHSPDALSNKKTTILLDLMEAEDEVARLLHSLMDLGVDQHTLESHISPEIAQRLDEGPASTIALPSAETTNTCSGPQPFEPQNKQKPFQSFGIR
ncbi:hypothetical protein MVEN_00046400 [Mycena venus]|uniref:Uncharacterized protein n=1 Tax=Mycena venus TaxID=2733690 RepID=A0A8H7DHT4_9AGAR|nr:hypothetical protein MVEN_00046400 [Mycena venus]